MANNPVKTEATYPSVRELSVQSDFAGFNLQRIRERIIEFFLFLAAMSSVAITVGIVGVLLYESEQFFAHVSIVDFLTDTQWTVLFTNPRYGIMPLVTGTLVTSITALVVALPLGTVVAIYLSEYANPRVREILKPVLELLSAVPTVVFGYFALLFLTPILQKFLPGLPGFNMLSAGIVIGIMIIPYISSLSEDAIKAVPVTIREGSYAMGATRLQTALRVLLPSAFSGIASAYVLGFSRAVGETMIVAIAAGTQPNLTLNPMEGAATITAYIVQVSLGDLPHGSIAYQSIFAAGLVLMLMTLAFNIGGFFLRKKFREIYE
ncbi:MAG: phosphate ABC transporter permease subunit PstC [Deltaproteobacteria bacterium]|nr:phosphate ABC transporter permease subunit PstC [Deltaproteobacteria bacterium]MDZ4345831.1 phosphate ABC transporter permease subunit PstC [Candidatus Binatia bacterium]